MSGAKVTVRTIAEKKASGERIVCVTAYDYMSAEIADAAGIDVILVGDSLANVMLGETSTVFASLEAMEHHTRAVRNGCKRPLLVADLPFGSYQSSLSQAVDSAVRLMKAGAEAVKLEGDYRREAEAMIRAGIPVMGHVGFTPQSVNLFGGHRVQGRGEAGDDVKRVASRMDESGCFGIVLELMPAHLATEITQSLNGATIGIGAGVGCDGEIQVWHDILGLSSKQYKHSRPFLSGRELFTRALQQYVQEVQAGTFPNQDNSF